MRMEQLDTSYTKGSMLWKLLRKRKMNTAAAIQLSLWNEKRILRAATQEDPKDNNSLSPLLYEGRKEKSMIKTEKRGK